MINISNRLARIASFVPQDMKMADIGSDHAYLPLYLTQSGKIVSAIAGEVNDGPFRGAERNVRAHGMKDKISVRKGNGLAVLEPGEVDVITIAGMGGGTIKEILSAGEAKLQGVSRLVLSPQGDGDTLRRWLLARGWKIVDEDMLVEDEQIYEIVVFERGEMQLDDPLALEFGPILLERKHPLIAERVEYEVGKIDRALRSIEKAKGETGQEKRNLLLARREQLEGVKSYVQS
ncbi:MAG: tRNA (adenine(22)-N(1))-methyltransferase [Tumebacillaceae bacterium]